MRGANFSSTFYSAARARQSGEKINRFDGCNVSVELAFRSPLVCKAVYTQIEGIKSPLQ
jgi:hypothetical protein